MLSFTRTEDISDAQIQFESDLKLSPDIWIPVEQSTLGLRASSSSFLLYQFSRASQGVGQIAVRIERSSKLKQIHYGFITHYGQQFRSSEDESEAFKLLIDDLRRFKFLLDLRIQIYGLDSKKAEATLDRAFKAGFKSVKPLGVTRSLVYNLGPSIEDQLAAFTAKTRSKLRPKYLENMEIRVLEGLKWVEPCQEALKASLARSGHIGKMLYDFKGAFQLQTIDPTRRVFFGLFDRSRPNELLAFVSAIRHDDVCEYSVAGSLPDPILRKLPFNYLLVWELMKWGKSHACTQFEMGGVTDGGPDDPLRGISEFKRHFTETECMVGFEGIYNLRPLVKGIWIWINTVLNQLRKK